MAKPNLKEASRLIDALGGTTEAAKFFNCFPGAISQWRKKGVPKARLQTLQHSHPHLFTK